MLGMRDRSVVKSSVIPSAKYCCSGSLLRLLKGSTTIDRRGAADAAGTAALSSVGAVAVADGAFSNGHSHHRPVATTSTPVSATAAMLRGRKSGLVGRSV